MERDIILTKLLKKYESSKHLCYPGVSNKRVMLQIEKRALLEYTYEVASVRDAYNAAAKKLETEGLVCIEWVAGRPVMAVVSLNLENVDQAYQAINRQHPREFVAQACQMLKAELSTVTSKWLTMFVERFCENAKASLTIPTYCNGDLGYLREITRVLACYDALGGRTITMRAFSLLCFQDSKRFEKEFQDVFLSIARAYHPELIEWLMQKEAEEISPREELSCVGIYSRAELYEITGDCKIKTPAGYIDVAASASHGIAIPSTLVDDIDLFDVSNIRHILFIENKTNYEEYILRLHRPHELVVYHGGFLSPQKRLLIQKLIASTPMHVDVFFWGDIDLGGFRMFSKLQHIIPRLHPLCMGSDDVHRYAKHGLHRSDEYLSKLELARAANEFPLFNDAIAAILIYGITIEQEIFLGDSSREELIQHELSAI